MFRSLDSMLGSAVVATDGQVGRAYNALIDDRLWAIRYLVVETGSWFGHRRVLISPEALGSPNLIEEIIPVLLTKEQVQRSPDVDTDRPVSRQRENCVLSSLGTHSPSAGADSERTGDPHLRSAKELAGYHVDASDGSLGDIADFIVEDQGWGILDLVVDAGPSPDGHKVVIPTGWVSEVSWEDRSVRLNRPRSSEFLERNLMLRLSHQ